jgi:5-methylcytosine-specific restriction endonuclease McrA
MFSCKGCGLMLPASEYRVHKSGYRIGKCRECERVYQREWSQRNPDEYRRRKREHMARRWKADPEAMRAYARANHAKNKQRVNARMREMNATRIFWARAQKLKGVSPRDLFNLWKAQRGLCALTGRRLDRSAQVDHILPKARGGRDQVSNLQWVCAEANLAKRNLTDAEFAALCGSVVRWIGERIAAVEAIQERLEAA